VKKLKAILGNTVVAFTVLGGYELGVLNERHFPGDHGFTDMIRGDIAPGEYWYLIALVVLACATPYIARTILPPSKVPRDDPS